MSLGIYPLGTVPDGTLVNTSSTVTETITAGTWNWTGQNIIVSSNLIIEIVSGTWNWTGQNIQVFISLINIIIIGTWNWTGQNINVIQNNIIEIISGTFRWLGRNIIVTGDDTKEQTMNDEKLNKLETALVKTGQINDLEVEWLQSLHVSVTSGSLDDAWQQYWDSQLIPAGQRNDRAYAWLGGLGYTGTLSKRWLDFWSAP